MRNCAIAIDLRHQGGYAAFCPQTSRWRNGLLTPSPASAEATVLGAACHHDADPLPAAGGSGAVRAEAAQPAAPEARGEEEEGPV